MKRRIKLLLSYDGSNYAGWQIQTKQPHVRTIQGSLEQALSIITKGKQIRVYGAGRTDAGVHARGQFCHFDLATSIPIDKLSLALNSVLPRDIRCHYAKEVEKDFHAQHWAKKKKYSYLVDRNFIPDVFLRNYALHLYQPLDFKGMELGAKALIGTKDFRGFSALGDIQMDTVRTIYDLTILEQEKRLIFQITGDGFLYNMVRIIVGTLLEIGKGKLPPSIIEEVIHTKNRILAGPTAAAKGLCLEKIYY